MTAIETLAENLSIKIADYRDGEIEKPTRTSVGLWVSQFPEAVRVQLLSEIIHILDNYYITKANFVSFLEALLTNPELSGQDPANFWRSVTVLDIQKDGHSQKDMNDIFAGLLAAKYGAPSKPSEKTYVYLDDVLFTGSRAGNDLESWIKDSAPASADVHVIFIGTHAFGSWKLGERLKGAAVKAGKKLEFKIWRAVEIENRKAYRAKSGVYWPASLTALSQEYSGGKFPLDPRPVGQTTTPFSSEIARQKVEEAFLDAGMKIRSFSANPAPILRPLGFGPFGVGFGATIVTYRNCPNNAPLALWWGDPAQPSHHPFSKWRPLFPRKTYAKSFGDYDF